MPAHRAVRLRYVFPDGERSDLADCEIDENERLRLVRAAPGAERRVSQMINELNERDALYIRTAMTSERTGRVVIRKLRKTRGSPGFWAALEDTARRFYGTEILFQEEKS